MKVLVVGGGGREHALVWKLSQSPLRPKLLVAPGNAGTAKIAENRPVAAEDIPGLLELVESEDVDLTVIGPEAPLVAGLADEIRRRGRPVFGPGREAARIEGSKAFAKEICRQRGIPTAGAWVFEDVGAAVAFLRSHPGPWVVKADGLAAGKGVVVASDEEEAVRAAVELMAISGRVLVEERLEGTELSVLALTDGERILPLLPARDHKRVGEGDRGPNTGGMGAFAPVPGVTEDLRLLVQREIISPAVWALAEAGAPFRGLIYAGLMLTASGPKLLEFNARFGDPETQVLLPLLRDDLLELLLASAEGRLKGGLSWYDGAALTVVLASKGYPGPYPKGLPISGLDEEPPPGVTIFHAGTALRDGRVVTAGGRVLAVTGRGESLAAARQAALAVAERIGFEGKHFRRDIGAV